MRSSGRRWTRRGRWHRCCRGAELEHQPRSITRITDGEGLPVVDDDGGHPHPVEVDAVSAPVEGDPLPAVVVQYQVRG
ncbi:hypothetical protein AWC26_08570 [Mycobacterium shimoidei]|nr:hypothetical protein AWC26_08570 [Mycobacterium shimoidei]